MASSGSIDLMMKSKLFEGFSEAECLELRTLLRPTLKEYSRRQMLINEGDRVDFLGLVESGRLTCTKFYYTGNSHIISVLEPFDLLGLETVVTPTRISPVTVTAQSVSSILVFDYDSLITDKVLHRTSRLRIMENLIKILGNEGIRQMYKIEVLSKRALRDRVMTYLCLMSQKRGKDTFSIRMTQEQLAQYLCVNRSALSAELNDMAREGLISFKRDCYSICRENPAWTELHQ